MKSTTVYVWLLDGEDNEVGIFTIEEAMRRRDLDVLDIGRIDGMDGEWDFMTESGYADKWDTRQALRVIAFVRDMSVALDVDVDMFGWNGETVYLNPFEMWRLDKEEAEENVDFMAWVANADRVVLKTHGTYDEHLGRYVWYV